MPTVRTPGIHVQEIESGPPMVVAASTGVPVFVGYTAIGPRAQENPAESPPRRIGSMQDYEAAFGALPDQTFSRVVTAGGTQKFSPTVPRPYLSDALRLFFANGGETAWVASVGSYGAGASAEDYNDAIWTAVAKLDEPSLLVCPDAVLFDWSGYKRITERMIRHCGTLGTGFAILDLHTGAGPDLETAIRRFRAEIDPGDAASFGAVYTPWMDTSLTSPRPVDFRALDADSRLALADDIASELAATGQADRGQAALSALRQPVPDETRVTQAHKALLALSPVYIAAINDLTAAAALTLPPAGAVAGVYARTDAQRGVWAAPAGTSARLSSVNSPTLSLTDTTQDDMADPAGGWSINPIRSFAGRGPLVWGARTLDGASNDWRYVPVRRTALMIEQSARSALRSFVFAPNDSATWSAVRTTLGAFLDDLWRQGGLVGSKPEEAFVVQVGLGTTMTSQDILDGRMTVSIGLALIRPAEFVLLTLHQKMQSS